MSGNSAGEGNPVVGMKGIAPPAALPSFMDGPTLAAPLPLPNPPPSAPSTNPLPGATPVTLMPPVLPTQSPNFPTTVSVSSPVPISINTVPPVKTTVATTKPSQPTTSLPVTSQPKHPGLKLDAENNNVNNCDVEESGSPGWVGWLKGTVSNVSQKVAQKAKTSMDTMITTLDPQMKQYLHSGGDMDVVVASEKEVKVAPVREAFQQVFGMATVTGTAAESSIVQPIDLKSCIANAEERINFIRSSDALAHPSLPVLAVENCLVELTDGSWYDVGVLLLDDPYHDILLQTFTQTTSVPTEWVTEVKNTPGSTIGEVAARILKVDRGSWHEAWCGVARRDMLLLAAKSLAHLYRSKLPA